MFSIVPRVFDEVDTFPRWSDDLYRLPAVINRYLAEPLAKFGESEINNTDRQICYKIDMKYFSPEEIHIKSDNDKITVHAKHEEKEANHGFICREFTRTFKLPDNVDPKSVTSTMTNDRILKITVDKKCIEGPKDIPIAVQYKG